MIALDRHPFARGGSVAIVSVSLLHLYQAFMWLTWPVAGGATCLVALLNVMHSMDSPDGSTFASAVLIVTALLGLTGALLRLGWGRLLLFIPQQVILGIMAGGGMLAMHQGFYLDGTVIPWQHIATDQMPMVVLLAVHTSAILRRCWDPGG